MINFERGIEDYSYYNQFPPTQNYINDYGGNRLKMKEMRNTRIIIRTFFK